MVITCKCFRYFTACDSPIRRLLLARRLACDFCTELCASDATCGIVMAIAGVGSAVLNTVLRQRCVYCVEHWPYKLQAHHLRWTIYFQWRMSVTPKRRYKYRPSRPDSEQCWVKTCCQIYHDLQYHGARIGVSDRGTVLLRRGRLW